MLSLTLISVKFLHLSLSGFFFTLWLVKSPYVTSGAKSAFAFFFFTYQVYIRFSTVVLSWGILIRFEAGRGPFGVPSQYLSNGMKVNCY